ncbi:selenocysteine-specific translation elongation factor [Acidicapsa dinghuensis]|uniref:Selenocysteine-specific translation elongation factor n=1 Tax=Acidicapsa dinghuensis TaxID=2218256 RepID=A0ABW1EBY2_9BACT|nr:selenocysteine-specific translation elongation factor [Acidicapsa dinghuensis]
MADISTRPDSQQPVAHMLPRTVVIGTAGHIDHGKTALIRALTGVDTDRLPDEKRRGITIDLGFASFDTSAHDGSPLQLSFIDVPGHARFVRNMLAGAGGIDAVLLVISAEEGVKPQTEEHLAICSILGIECGLTVLTKKDAVDSNRLKEVRSSVKQFLSTTFLSSEPLIEVSAYTGFGLDTLKDELRKLETRISCRDSDRLVRLPLDRAFAMKGFGTVVTGTLISGSVAAGQEIAIEPGARMAKVRGIQSHGRTSSEVKAATRVALNLTRLETSELSRGDTLVEPGTLAAVDLVDVEIRLLATSPVLKHRARVHFHAFASECTALVLIYGYTSIDSGGKCLARLRLTKPTVLLPGDRFVLRYGASIQTIGGGRILDAHPVQPWVKSRAQTWLEQIRWEIPDQQLVFRIARRGMTGIRESQLSAEAGLRVEAIHAHLAQSIKEENIYFLDDELLIVQKALLDATTLVGKELERLFHSSGIVGVKRSAVGSQMRLQPAVFTWALRRLARAGKLRIVNELLLPGEINHDQTEHNQAKIASICSAYEKAGLASPAPDDLALELGVEKMEMRRLITTLLREQKLIRLGSDSLCMHQKVLAQLKEQMRTLRGQSLSIADFKDITGVSRKYAIPLLEYLDREHVTRRQGKDRVVL